MPHIVKSSGVIEPIEGYVYRFLYVVKTHEYKQFVQPYYTSKSGRICSKIKPQFEGLNPKRLGQFHSEGDMFYEMFSTNENYHENKMRFMSSVLKRLKKSSKID